MSYLQNKKGQDPFGTAINDHMKGNLNAEIIVECPLLENDTIPVSYLFREENEMPALERFALKCCKGKVLDIGAGAGSHSLVLQKNKIDTTALDISQLAVDAMKKRGILKVIRADIKSFFSEDKFDTILMLMNGIGLVGTLVGLDIFLKEIKKNLNPGGQILLDSTDIIYLFEEDDGSVMIGLHANYYGEIKYKMHYGEISGDQFDWLYIDFLILNDHAAASGLICEKLFEDGYSYLARLTF